MMAWHLVDEVLDCCPRVTYIEFRILIALARDAREDTRQAMPGHEALALRGNCGLRNVRLAIAGLIDRGLVKQISGSSPGRRAVYEILPMASEHRQATLPPNTGKKHANVGKKRPERRQATLPPLGSGPLVHSPISAQALIGEWIDHCPKRPPQRVVGQVGKHVKEMLGEGIDPADIRRGLAAWKAKGLGPSVLPSVVNEVMNGTRRVSARQAETDEMFDRAMQRARARDAARDELQ